MDQRSDLEQAVRSIDTARHGDELVIEPYCDGPEFDANFVILDGEILFFEICDDFPKSADKDVSAPFRTFIELDSVFPSRLPKHEIDMIRDAFHQSLLRLGLCDGIMHLKVASAIQAWCMGSETASQIWALVKNLPIPSRVPGSSRSIHDLRV